MNLSLQHRIFLAMLGAGVLVAFVGVTSFYLMDDLTAQLQGLLSGDIELTSALQELRIQVMTVRGLHRQLKMNPADPELSEELQRLQTSLDDRLASVKAAPATPSILRQLVTLQTLLAESDGKTRALLAEPTSTRRAALSEEIRRGLASALELIAAVERERQSDLGLKRRQASEVASYAHQRIVLVMGVAIFAMIALSLLAPPKVVIPLKRIETAIRDVENCKFETSIQLRGSTEMTAIATALNRMIARLKTFDDLKVEQIRLENVRFETLANLVGVAIMVCRTDGRVLMLNNAFYAMFDFSSAEVLNHPVEQSPLPAELIDLVSHSLHDGHRLTREAFFFVRPSDLESERTLLVSSGLVRDAKGELRYGVFSIEERSRTAEKPEKIDKSDKA